MSNNFYSWLIISGISLLFFGISSISHDIQATYLTENQLFSFYGKINSIVSLFIPISVILFHSVTSGLMFELLNVEYDRKKLLDAIALSLVPVLIHCALYTTVLYTLRRQQNIIHENLEDLHRQTTAVGLSLNDLKPANIVSWAAFYLIYVFSVKDAFRITLLKSIVICLLPISVVVAMKHLFL